MMYFLMHPLIPTQPKMSWLGGMLTQYYSYYRVLACTGL